MKILIPLLCITIAYWAWPNARAEDEHDHEHADHEEHAHDAEPEEHYDHSHDHAEDVEVEPDILEEFGIAVDEARAGTIARTTTLAGEVRVNGDRTAHIVPRYPGVVLEVHKNIGDQVETGDVLAVIESNESLAPYELTSRIEGTIIEKHITLGESLGDDEVAFVVTDLSTVWVDLTLYQRDLQSVKAGQPVTVEGGHHLPSATSVISYVSPTLDEHTRTGHARAVLDNPHGEWKPGLFVSGRVDTGEESAAVVIPSSALQTVDDQTVVFVKTAEGFEPRPVESGRRNRTSVEILSGLEPGERYVSAGGLALKAELARGQLEHAGHAH